MPASGTSVDEREMPGAQRAGRRRSPRCVRARRRRGSPRSCVEHRRQQRVREADRAAARARAPVQRAPGRARPASTAARSSSDSDGVPSAAASASASRVVAGRPEILARTSSSSVSGTGSGSSGSASTSSTRASSSAKNGLPPERSWMRSSVWRANVVPRRSRRSRCSAPTLSGPTGSAIDIASASACSSSDGAAPSARRRASSRRTGRRRGGAARRRARSPRTASSHWTSSIATSERLPFAEELQRVADGDARARAGRRRRPRLVLEQQRDLERAPPRGRERRQHVVEDALEEVPEPA